MAPSRIRPGAEDIKSETASVKERPTPTGQGQSAAGPNGKGRRQVSSTTGTTGGGSGKDTGSSNIQAVQSGNGASSSNGQDGAGSNGIAWSTFDISILHAYRHAYRLSTPSSFSSSLNHMTLSNPGIGRYSPTMARARERRRVSRDQLALAVRKHFNGLGIQEGEVVVDFLYKVRWQNRDFRMRFGPRVTR